MQNIERCVYRILRNKRTSPNKRPLFLFVIANYEELKGKSEVLENLMQNSRKKWDLFNSDFKSARGAYYAEYGKDDYKSFLILRNKEESI